MDRLQSEWTTGQVVRVNILEAVGREFARAHAFEGTPTFVLFDGAGREVRRWRGGPPTLADVIRSE